MESYLFLKHQFGVGHHSMDEEIDLLGSKHLIRFSLKPLLYLVFALLLAGARLAWAAPEALVLTSDINHISVGKHMAYWRDGNGQSHIRDVLTVADDQWVPSTNNVPTLGFTGDRYWFRFAIHNGSNRGVSLLLSSNYASIDFLNYYVVQNGKVIDKFETGDQLPYASRRIDNRNFIMPLNIAAGEIQQIYMEVQTQGIVQLPVILRSLEDYNRYEQRFLMSQGGYYGIALIMVLYNLIVFAAVRDSTYLLFVLSIGAYAIYQASISGFAFQYLWPQFPEMNQKGVIFGMSLYGFAGCFFAVSFLRLKQFHGAFYRFYSGLGLLFLALFLLTLLNLLPYNFAVRATVGGGVFGAVAVFAIGVVMLVRGHKVARFFVLAYGSVLALIVIDAMGKTGVIPSSVFTEYSPQVGSIAQVLFLSFALADRINIDRDAGARAQQSLYENEKRVQEEQARYLRLQLKLQEEELKASQKIVQAKAESKAKSDFLATMSHEIRTPMNGVLGMTELLQSTDLKPEQKQYLDVIAGSGKALLNIINDILDYSKIEAGKMEVETVNLDLDKLMIDSVSVFSMVAQNKNIELLLTISPSTPYFIQSDPTRLRQIVLNLMDNAFKFTDTGSVMLSVHLMEQQGDQYHIRFEVRDSGIGVDADQKQKLFSAFSQADSSTTRQFGGTGLGLSISKRLAELLGGNIGVESAPGRGAIFWFSIRCGLADNEFIQQQTFNTAAFSGKQILVVDGSLELTHIMHRQMNYWGITCEVEDSIDGALANLEQRNHIGQPYDLVIIGSQLADGTGIELAQKMALTEQAIACPRILMGNLGAMPEPSLLEALSINRYLRVPFSARMLNEMLHAELKLTQKATSIEQSGVQPTLQAKPNSAFSDYTVLVAEDNVVNRMVVQGLLTRFGLNFEMAEDGQQAVELYQQYHQRYALILMDCEMPHLDGYDAAKQIRAYEQTHGLPRMPILALTAHVVKEHQEKVMASGMDYYIAKPVEAKVLQTALMMYLGHEAELTQLRG